MKMECEPKGDRFNTNLLDPYAQEVRLTHNYKVAALYRRENRGGIVVTDRDNPTSRSNPK